MKRLFFLVFLSGFIYACSIEPRPINYSLDACDFCKMNIVDPIHGAEIVTDKGKVYVFDAAECMINFKSEMTKENVGLILTNHYHKAGELIDARKATYLISKNLPSPMGAYITAFESKDTAEKAQKELEGTLYSWTELLKNQNYK